MIVFVLAIFLFITFMILGGIHVYWLFGGSWGLKKVIPTKSKDSEPNPPPTFATLIVALGLISFGILYLLKLNIVSIPIPEILTKFIYWFIPAIFILRAIGEFKYVGFFKKIKDTEFAIADTKIFSPLCLGIGLAGLVIEFTV